MLLKLVLIINVFFNIVLAQNAMVYNKNSKEGDTFIALTKASADYISILECKQGIALSCKNVGVDQLYSIEQLLDQSESEDLEALISFLATAAVGAGLYATFGSLYFVKFGVSFALSNLSSGLLTYVTMLYTNTFSGKNKNNLLWARPLRQLKQAGIMKTVLFLKNKELTSIDILEWKYHLKTVLNKIDKINCGN